MNNLNPYQSPEIIAEPSTDHSRVQSQLAPVSLGIMMGAVVHWIPAIFVFPIYSAQTVLFLLDPFFTPQQTWNSAVIATIGLLVVVLSSCAFYGAWQMRRLRSRRWAIAACVLAIVPNGVSYVSLFLGIWGLRLLLRPSVRAAFEAKAR